MLGYDTVFNETMRYYLKDEYSFTREKSNQFKTEKLETKVIDEYLLYLIEGYINVEIDKKLERYLIRLLDEEWFHQWPAIRWAYGTRLLNSKRPSKRNITRAINILVPLAKEGYPGAMCDIADCFYQGIGVEWSYEKAICLWIVSSKMGYRAAYEKLKFEWESQRAKDLPEELRFFLMHRILCIFIEEHSVRVENSVIQTEGLSEYETETLIKIFNRFKRLCKVVSNKAHLRYAGNLWWNENESPYSIGVKLT